MARMDYVFPGYYSYPTPGAANGFATMSGRFVTNPLTGEPVRMRNDLKNSGWVRHTLETALWATMTTLSFEEALVKAVNLGNDADTGGAITGAIAGALYGLSGIPARWKEAIHGEYPLRSGKLWFLNDFIDLAANKRKFLI